MRYNLYTNESNAHPQQAEPNADDVQSWPVICVSSGTVLLLKVNAYGKKKDRRKAGHQAGSGNPA